MKKTIRTILGICLAAVVAVSCENFLDTTSYTDSNTSNFPASAEDAQQLVTGIYSAFNVDLYDNCGTNFWMYANVISDDEFGGGGADDSDIQAVDHMLYSDKNYQAEYWTSCYNGIGRANMALANLDKVEDEDLRNQLMGETHILRAYYYFVLTQMFEEVPLVTAVPSNVGDAQQYPTVGTVDQIYAFIAADLKKAIEIMPSKPYNACVTGKGHVTKWVAEGLLARVYMFYTGFYSDKNGSSITTLPLVDLETGEPINETVSKDYVISALNDCIANSGHALLKDFRQLWAYSNEDTAKDYPFMDGCTDYWVKDLEGSEDMFDICCGRSHHQENKMLYYVGMRQGSNNKKLFPMNRGYGFGPVNPALYKEWMESEPGDIRMMGSIYSLEVEGLDPSTYEWGNDNALEETGLFQKKAQAFQAYVNGTWMFEALSSNKYYGDGKTDLGRKYNPSNLTLMRFAEILLMHSELTQTVDGINKVRVRANLSPIASYSFEALEKERRHELAFEGLRWGDMRRWGKAYCIKALNSQVGQDIHNYGKETKMNDQGAGYEARYNATWGFRDYPDSEISLSAGALKSKSGWGTEAQYTGWK